MGLFSKTKTYIESTSVPLLAESKGTAYQTIINAVVRDRNISDDLLSNTLNGLGRKSKIYYSYGKRDYLYGLPEGTLEAKYASADTIQTLLVTLLNQPTLEVVNNLYGSADSGMFAREFLVNTREWEPETNIVNNPGFVTVNTVSLYSTEWVDNTTIKLSYFYGTIDNLVEELITVPSVDVEDSYYHVSYILNEDETVVYYWFYKPSLGTYPELDVDINEFESEYFPVVPLIRDNVDLTDDSLKDTELYNTSKRLLFKMGIDFKDLGKGLQESPDIDELDHAYVNISAAIQSESQNIQKYLFEHFLYLYERQLYDKSVADAWEDSGPNPPEYNKIIVKETENNSGQIGNFHTELGFRYIEDSTVTGNIGKVKHVTRETVILPSTSTKYLTVENSYMIWRKQVTPTEYRELKVVGLKHINYVYGSKSIDTSLEDSLIEDNDDFNVMVNIKVLDKFSILTKSDILNDCIRLCLNSVVRVKLKWYQTSFFKALVIVVSAVISVATLGSGSGALAWAVAITGATTFIAQLAVALILNQILSVLARKLIDTIGLEAFAILLLIYTMDFAYLNAVNGTLLTADSLIKIASGFAESASYYLKDQYQSVVNEYENIILNQKEQQAELDKLIEAMPTSFLDPLSFLDPSKGLNESLGNSVDSYYDIRIHTGNIGVLVLDQISNYVDLNLQQNRA